MPESLRIDFSRPIPVFPLPDCVLLPGATVPLHIFEPRYRAMAADVLASNGLLAMALFADADWHRDYQGAPALRRHVCVGYIVRHHRHDDGRYDILLQGVCRARIVEETPHQPYRLARLLPTEVRTVLEIDLGEPRRRFEALLEDPLLSELAAVSAIKNWLNEEVPSLILLDLAIMSLCERTEDRYAMLAEPEVDRRFAFLECRLQQTRRTLQTARRYCRAPGDDGFTLN
jgi:Lon protease-like protein